MQNRFFKKREVTLKIWAVLKQEPSAEVFQEASDGVLFANLIPLDNSDHSCNQMHIQS